MQTCCPDKEDFFLCPPRLAWYVTADGAAIRRSSGHSVDIAALGTTPQLPSDSTEGPTSIVLSTRDFNYDFAAAGRLFVGYTCNECFQVEGGYLGIHQTENMAAVRDNTLNAVGGTGNLFSPFGGFGFAPNNNLDYNNLARIDYSSSLQSAEVNIRRRLPLVPERLTASIFVGVRYIGIPEDFYYLTQQSTGAVNAFHVATDNEMIGPQIGAMFEVYTENRWWINFEMKAALMNNRAQQWTDYQHVETGTEREDHTSFVGDLALSCVYRWSPHFTTRLGYQALFLTGLALAPDNLNTNFDILTQGPAQLNHGANSIYQGPFAGVTVGW